VFLVALAKSGAVAGQLSCDVRRQRRRGHDGIGAVALVPVEAEHYSGRQAGGERLPALLLAGQ
jgi:hypothetical protein